MTINLVKISEVVFLSFEWSSLKPGGPAHGIVTKTVHKTLPGDRGQGVEMVGSRADGGQGGGRGQGVVGV